MNDPLKPEAMDSKAARDFHAALKALRKAEGSTRTRYIQWLAAAATTISLGLVANAFFESLPIGRRPDAVRQLAEQTVDLDKRLSALERKVSKLKLAGQHPGPSASVDLSEQASQRLSVLESAVLDNPEKSLSLVLLRREVAEIHSAMAINESASQREISRVYDLTKIAVGAIFGMVLGVLGLVLTQLLPKKLPVTLAQPARNEVDATEQWY